MDMYKVTNDTVTNYMVSATKQVIDFNTKMVAEYVDFNRKLIASVPGLDAWVSKLPGFKS